MAMMAVAFLLLKSFIRSGREKRDNKDVGGTKDKPN
jgi:hypothetical protein